MGAQSVTLVMNVRRYISAYLSGLDKWPNMLRVFRLVILVEIYFGRYPAILPFAALRPGIYRAVL